MLDALHRNMLWFCENWDGDNKTSYAGPCIIEPMVFCWYHTGDDRLIRFAEDYAEYLCEHDFFGNSYRTYLNEELRYFSNHTAGVGTSARLPALLYTAAYGPCRLETDGLTVTEETMYPFRQSVRFTVDSDRPRTVFLKIPAWAKGYSVTRDGESIAAAKNEDGYAPVALRKAGTHTVEIRFDAEVEILRVDDSNMASKFPMAIRFGALIYSFHIPEIWCPTAGSPMTPLPEGWSWYNVIPNHPHPGAKDPHENMALKRNVISWNVALDENLRPEDVKVEEIPADGYVWENPPIRLHITGYKAPYLCASYPSTTMEPFGDRQYVTEQLSLTLVPYGCTNLRITFFPHADLSGK